MANKEIVGGKLLKLTCAYYYETDTEPDIIDLKDTTVAIGVTSFLSGYHGMFSQTKGFKPVKDIVDRINKRYTIIDFVLCASEFNVEMPSDGMLINFKELNSCQRQPIYDEIKKSSFLYDRIEAHGGLAKAFTDDPSLLTEAYSALGRFRNSVFIHTVKPPASPALVVASIHRDLINTLVISASCRFNKKVKVVW